MIRAYGLAAALICYARDAAACLRSLAGNGRPDDLMALADATAEPVPPPWANDPTPLATAAMDFLRRSLAELEAVETVADLLYAAGEDA